MGFRVRARAIGDRVVAAQLRVLCSRAHVAPDGAADLYVVVKLTRETVRFGVRVGVTLRRHRSACRTGAATVWPERRRAGFCSPGPGAVPRGGPGAAPRSGQPRLTVRSGRAGLRCY